MSSMPAATTIYYLRGSGLYFLSITLRGALPRRKFHQSNRVRPYFTEDDHSMAHQLENLEIFNFFSQKIEQLTIKF